MENEVPTETEVRAGPPMETEVLAETEVRASPPAETEVRAGDRSGPWTAIAIGKPTLMRARLRRAEGLAKSN